MKEYAKALNYYQKSLIIKQQSLPPNHPDLANIYNNIASVHCELGDYPKALEFYQNSLEIKEQSC